LILHGPSAKKAHTEQLPRIEYSNPKSLLIDKTFFSSTPHPPRKSIMRGSCQNLSALPDKVTKSKGF